MGPLALRGRIAVVTTYWGEDGGDEVAAVRLVAGALARELEVHVVHLDRTATGPSRAAAGAFTLHRLPARASSPTEDRLVRLALGGSAPLPERLDDLLHTDPAVTGAVAAVIDGLDPDAVVLCGTAALPEPAALGGPGRRVVLLPLSGDGSRLADPVVVRHLDAADLVLAAHPGEERLLRERLAGRPARVEPLELALSVNRGATADTLFGVRFFQPFALVLRAFPPGGARLDRAVTHEVVTAVAGELRRSEVPASSWRSSDGEVPDTLPLAVAEVDGDTWRLADRENMLPLPVSPTRVNLWRLMAHALFVVDLRPAGPLGRETIESFLFSTPVVVPDRSAAMAHAMAANGGLWYRNEGELLAAVRVLTDRRVRERLAENGQAYARARHGDLARFVERVCGLVLPRPGTGG